MVEVFRTSVFDAWLSGLKDRRAVARIAARIDRLALGSAGDAKPVGSGVSEMRVDYGPGYRVYYRQRGSLVVVLLCGGEKRTQDADIRRAIQLAGIWQKQVKSGSAASPKANKKR
jgi:putative addiction module killer protein